MHILIYLRPALFIAFIITATLFQLLDPPFILTEEFQINQTLSLDTILAKTIIKPGENQTLKFFLKDISGNKNITTLVKGNIIYLAGAQTFLTNITNGKWYQYSWMINPKIQDFGTVLVGINLLYNGTNIHVEDLSFSIDGDKINGKKNK